MRLRTSMVVTGGPCRPWASRCVPRTPSQVIVLVVADNSYGGERSKEGSGLVSVDAKRFRDVVHDPLGCGPGQQERSFRVRLRELAGRLKPLQKLLTVRGCLGLG